MRSKKSVQALVALAICTLGYLGPWWLGMFQPLQAPLAVAVAEPERVVTLVHLPPQQTDLPEPEVEVIEDASPDAAEVEGPPMEAVAAVDGDAEVTIPELPIAVEAAAVGTPSILAKAKKARVTTSRRSKRPVRTCLPERDDIGPVGKTAFRVEDGLVYYYANHIQEASKLAASWWNRDDEGERFGFKIGRMKCGSVLRQAGFQNGDVITRVNGHEIRSYADGVTAFMRLRAKRILWVDVERRGEPVRIDFVLVDDGEALVEYDEDHPLADPTALVERELELAELPWLQRRLEKGKDRRGERRLLRQSG